MATTHFRSHNKDELERAVRYLNSAGVEVRFNHMERNVTLAYQDSLGHEETMVVPTDEPTLMVSAGVELVESVSKKTKAVRRAQAARQEQEFQDSYETEKLQGLSHKGFGSKTADLEPKTARGILQAMTNKWLEGVKIPRSAQ